jgi:PAS domain S-box-containing protein
MPVAVAVYDAQDLRLLEANRLFLTIMDLFLDPCWQQGRIIGSPLTDWAHPANISSLVTIFRAVAETGTTSRVGEFAFSASQGHTTYWNWTLDRMDDHDGQDTHLLQTITEVTAHVLASQEAEQARLRGVLDQLPEGVLLVEAAGECISYANAASASLLGVPIPRIQGFSLSRLAQSRVPSNLDGLPIPLEEFPLVRGLRGETVSGREMRVARPDGRNVVLLCSAAPLRSEGGVITGAVVVFQDITERKSLEQHKNEFLSMASHELRTPITTIQGLAEILQQLSSSGQSLDTPRSLRAITIMAEQSQHLTRLIEEMLDFSRLEQAQLVFYPAPHDLLRTLVLVVESQAVTTRKHGIRLVLDGLQANDTLIACFDEERMVQVLNNLISNAIKYSPGGGEIELGLQRSLEQPDEALIWVRDHGIGIPANVLPHVFERFYRSGKLDCAMSGLGIGLYLVKEIVTCHGGRVWVESIEGVGSTFYVQLPLDHYQAHKHEL